MNTIFSFFLFLFSIVILSSGYTAASAEPAHIAQHFTHEKLPEIEAKAWALMDASTGWIVAGKNITDKIPPASITKLMSNYVVYQALESGQVSLSDQVLIPEKAWRTEGSRMFAEVGSQLTLEQLLKSTVIQSGNDAAVALAVHISGSESNFAKKMNESSKQLGLKESHFMNSTGLPDEQHVMSVRDIAVLSASIIQQFPEMYSWYAEKSFRHNNITQYNRNKLLWKDSSVDGIKTGYTKAAGYCLAGSAVRNNQRWIAVVMGAKNIKKREKAVLDLLNYGFNHFEPSALFEDSAIVSSVPVWKGESDDVALKALSSVNLILPRGRKNDVNIDFRLAPSYEAPIEKNQVMGMAVLSLEGEELASVPLVAVQAIEKGSLWKRLVDNIKLWMQE